MVFAHINKAELPLLFGTHDLFRGNSTELEYETSHAMQCQSFPPPLFHASFGLMSVSSSLLGLLRDRFFQESDGRDGYEIRR
jgi:hypothetical protein